MITCRKSQDDFQLSKILIFLPPRQRLRNFPIASIKKFSVHLTNLLVTCSLLLLFLSVSSYAMSAHRELWVPMAWQNVWFYSIQCHLPPKSFNLVQSNPSSMPTRGAALHRGSILASHLAAMGSKLAQPIFFLLTA